MKGLYFLRLWRKTSYLIYLIGRVLKDVIPFLIVMTVTVLAFMDGFLIVSNFNKDTQDEDGNDLRFIGVGMNAFIYVYKMVLGDFDMSSRGQVAENMVLIFFLACTVINTVIMLNLLIAIISETFNLVN